jgi:hypothetical protein
MERFHHSPLDNSKREIRLLHLFPRDQLIRQQPSPFNIFQDEEPISCLLETVSLNDSPKYNALSYTWGKPELTHQIWVNNAILPVTESLAVALRHLRQESEILILWVDAVCINQRDTDEKNHQVRQMAEVYRHAAQVFVWLGPAADESCKVIEYLRFIATKYAEHGLTGVSDFSILEMTKAGEKDRAAALTHSRIELFQKLDYLFIDIFPSQKYLKFAQRGWWSRAWVIQEICLAQEPMYLCGEKKLPSVHLVDSINFLSSYGVAQSTKLSQMRSPEEIARARDQIMPLVDPTAMKALLAIRGQYQKQQGTNPGPTLFSLLRTVYTRRTSNVPGIMASDRRDKVFALLGLASDKDELQIRIDYSKEYSASDLFTSVSETLLMHGYLDLLSFRRTVNDLQGDLPSWVCDWNQKILVPFGNPIHVDKPFAASGISKSQVITYMADGQHIAAIQGLRVDEIDALGPPWLDRRTDEVTARWKTAAVFMEETEAICRGYSVEDTVNVLLGGLEIHGGGTEGNPSPSRSRRVTRESLEAYKIAKRWVKIIKKYEYLTEHIRDPRNITTRIFQTYMENSREMQEVANLPEKEAFLTGMDKGEWFERRPFRSEKGYIGLAPQRAEVGDTICIFFGSTVPHIIRPVSEDRYKLIGESYVLGIMDGELIGNESSSMTFELC